MDRPSIDRYLMNIALASRDRSDWPGTKVGCVASVDGMVLGTGYNGTPKGWRPLLNPEGTTDREAARREMRPYLCHAEENVIVQAARAGVQLVGAHFHVTLSPCLNCAAMMVNVGAERVVFLELWDGPGSDTALKLLGDLGIEVIKLEAGK